MRQMRQYVLKYCQTKKCPNNVRAVIPLGNTWGQEQVPIVDCVIGFIPYFCLYSYFLSCDFVVPPIPSLWVQLCDFFEKKDEKEVVVTMGLRGLRGFLLGFLQFQCLEMNMPLLAEGSESHEDQSCLS